MPKRHRAETAGADINVSLQGRPDDYIAMSFGPNIVRTPDALATLTTDLIGQVSPDGAGAEVSLVIASTRFASGTALVEAAKELDEPLKGDEVRQ